MFYSEFVLTKKGPLAKIWLAAHWEKKLTKNQITETNISTSVKDIAEPVVPIALRTSGHLLLGVVKIYSRKVRYVLQECKEAETKIKLQIVPETKVDLSEKANTASYASITLPDRVTEIDLMLPDIDLTTLVNPASLAHIPRLNRIHDNAQWDTATGDDTEPSVRVTYTPAKADDAIDMPGYGDDVDMDNQLGYGQDVYNEAIPMQSPDFPDAALDPFHIPQEDKEEEIRRQSMRGEQKVEPQQPEEEEEEPKKVQRKRKVRDLIVDDEIEISTQEFKRRVNDAGDLVRIRERAPATLEESENQLDENRDIFAEPLLKRSTLAPEFLELYRLATSKLNVRHAEREQEMRDDQVVDQSPQIVPGRPSVPGTPKELDMDQPPASPIGYGIDAPGYGDDDNQLGYAPGYGDVFPETPQDEPKRKRQSVAPSPLIDIEMQTTAYANIQQRKSELFQEIVAEKSRDEIVRAKEAQHQRLKSKYHEKNITDSTITTIAMFQDMFDTNGDDQLKLADLTRNMKRAAAARIFYETLVLKTRDFVDVEQSEPFGDIIVTNNMVTA